MDGQQSIEPTEQRRERAYLDSWSRPQMFVLTARDAESSDGAISEGNIYMS